MSIQDLNKRIRHLPKEDKGKFRKRRRILKNRKYALKCRRKGSKETMGIAEQNKVLQQEIDRVAKELKRVINERDVFKSKCSRLSEMLSAKQRSSTQRIRLEGKLKPRLKNMCLRNINEKQPWRSWAWWISAEPRQFSKFSLLRCPSGVTWCRNEYSNTILSLHLRLSCSAALCTTVIITSIKQNLIIQHRKCEAMRLLFRLNSFSLHAEIVTNELHLNQISHRTACTMISSKCFENVKIVCVHWLRVASTPSRIFAAEEDWGGKVTITKEGSVVSLYYRLVPVHPEIAGWKF